MAHGTQKGFLSQVSFCLASPDPRNSGRHLTGAQGWRHRPLVPALLLLIPLAGTGRLIVRWEGVESEAALWPSPSVHLVFGLSLQVSAGVGDKAERGKEGLSRCHPWLLPWFLPPLPCAGLAPHCAVRTVTSTPGLLGGARPIPEGSDRGGLAPLRPGAGGAGKGGVKGEEGAGRDGRTVVWALVNDPKT